MNESVKFFGAFVLLALADSTKETKSKIRMTK